MSEHTAAALVVLTKEITTLRRDLNDSRDQLAGALHERDQLRTRAADAEENFRLVTETLALANNNSEQALARCIAAEAEAARLRDALSTWPQDGSVHEPGCAVYACSDRECDCFTATARAAFGGEETSDGE